MIDLDKQASNKVQITVVPRALPAKCASCGYAGGDSDRYFIDFGLDIDFYGVVYFCTDCFRNVCVSLDYAGPSTVQSLRERVAVLEAAVKQYEGMKDVLGGMADYVNSIGGVLTGNLADAVVVAAGAPSHDLVPGEYDLAPTELASESGPDDVRPTKRSRELS